MSFYRKGGKPQPSSRVFMQGNRMKKTADKNNPKYLPEVCSLIRENAHNELNDLHSTANTAHPKYPSALKTHMYGLYGRGDP